MDGLKININKIMIIKFGIDVMILSICCIIVLICLLKNLEIVLYIMLIKIFNIVVIILINNEIWVFFYVFVYKFWFNWLVLN